MPINSEAAKERYRELWLSPATSGTVLLVMLLDSYGQELFDNDAATLRMDIEDGFRVDNIPQVNIDKVMGLWCALTTDLVHTDPSTFINVANALNNVPVDPAVFDPADPYETAWALTELSMLDPGSAGRYSPEVKRYVGEICKAFGLYRPPASMAAVADFGDENHVAAMESHAEDGMDMQFMTQQQTEFRNDIASYVSRKMARLLNELDKVPLANRDKESWSSFMRKAIKTLTGQAV